MEKAKGRRYSPLVALYMDQLNVMVACLLFS